LVRSETRRTHPLTDLKNLKTSLLSSNVMWKVSDCRFYAEPFIKFDYLHDGRFDSAVTDM
jgi:hypothetical protein